MNINDVRFGNLRKEGREHIGSGRKYTVSRLFMGRWVLCKGSLWGQNLKMNYDVPITQFSD